MGSHLCPVEDRAVSEVVQVGDGWVLSEDAEKLRRLIAMSINVKQLEGSTFQMAEEMRGANLAMDQLAAAARRIGERVRHKRTL